jgi:hypothetical protein
MHVAVHDGPDQLTPGASASRAMDIAPRALLIRVEPVMDLACLYVLGDVYPPTQSLVRHYAPNTIVAALHEEPRVSRRSARIVGPALDRQPQTMSSTITTWPFDDVCRKCKTEVHRLVGR